MNDFADVVGKMADVCEKIWKETDENDEDKEKNG